MTDPAAPSPSHTFAAHLAALACVPDPDGRAVSRLLGVVVQEWSDLAASRAPTFELDGATLWVGETPVRLLPPWRVALAGLEAALRSHGVGGVRLNAPVDRGVVLALLRGPRVVSPSAPRDELQRWLAAHGGGPLTLLPPRPPPAPDSRAPLRPVLHAWAAFVAAVDAPRTAGAVPPPRLLGALRAFVDEGIREPRALPVALAFAGPRSERRPAAVAALALILGLRLGIPRGALADLVLAAVEATTLPPRPGPDAVARVLARRTTGSLGLPDARLAVTLWGLASIDRAPPRAPHLHARILALADEADALLRAEGPGRLLPDEGIARLQANGGRRADTPLVDALVSCLGRYPVGSAIVLDTGEVGIVCRAPASAEHVGRPVVRVVVDRTGTLLGGGPLLDLAQPARARTRIVATVDPARLGIGLAEAVLA